MNRMPMRGCLTALSVFLGSLSLWAQPANLPTGPRAVWEFGLNQGYTPVPNLTRTTVSPIWDVDDGVFIDGEGWKDVEEFDLRYSLLDPLEAGDWSVWWENAGQADGEPDPVLGRNGGNGYFYATVTGLVPGRTYWLFLRARYGTVWSGSLWNYQYGDGLEVATLPDFDPPAAPADLSVIYTMPDAATLAWTAPGNDGMDGTAFRYEVVYSPEDPSSHPALQDWWDRAWRASGAPAPAEAWTSQGMMVSGLEPLTSYWFAIRAWDEAGQAGPSSNVAAGFTPASSWPGGDTGPGSRSSCGGMAGTRWTPVAAVLSCLLVVTLRPRRPC